MSSQSNINNIIINQLSESKYNQITPEEGEFYCTPDTNIATKDWTESLINDIMNSLYPVGSTYITTASTCPLATLISGSTWTKVSEGRVLWGSDSNHSAGTTIEAGLPNITGTITYITADNGNANTGQYPTNGAFRWGNEAYTNKASLVSGGGSRDLTFNASRSNSIYGKSSTVQPPAFVVNIWKRTA